jgi:hypothetical protein
MSEQPEGPAGGGPTDPAHPPAAVPQYGYGPPPPPPGSGYGPPVAGGFPPDPLISPDFAGWWQRGLQVVRRSWRQLAILQAIVAVFTVALQGAAAVSQSLSLRELNGLSETETPPLGTVLGASALTFVASIGAVLMSTLVTLAAVRIVVVTATGGQPDVAEALRGAARRLFPMIGWSLLAGLIVVAGICACIMPGLYFWAVFSVLAPVVAFERGGAIGRCFTLFHGDLGRSLARIATVIGILFAGTMVAALVAVVGDVFADPLTAPTPALVAAALVSTAIGVVVGGGLRVLTDPLTVAAYADMRARIEPLSSAMLAHEITVR